MEHMPDAILSTLKTTAIRQSAAPATPAAKGVLLVTLLHHQILQQSTLNIDCAGQILTSVNENDTPQNRVQALGASLRLEVAPAQEGRTLEKENSHMKKWHVFPHFVFFFT